MRTRIIPTYYYKSVDLIEVDKLAKLGYKYALVDLDNTLTGFHHAHINSKGQKFLDACKKYDIQVFVVSNNKESRVKEFCDPLNLKYIFHSEKPFTLKINHFIKRNNIDKNKTIAIGDQIFTDIYAANCLRIKSILVEPVQSKDLILTMINRLRDKKIRKILKDKGLLKGIE